MKNKLLKFMFIFTFLAISNAEAALYSVKDDTGLPSCESNRLWELVYNKIKAYQEQNPGRSLVEKRSQAMMLNDIKGFKGVPHANFTSEQDYNVATELITTKINKAVPEDQIRLCKSNSNGPSTNIYLLVYKNYDVVQVHILNFTVMEKNFSVIYN